MNLALKPKLKKFVQNQVKAGRYDTAEDVVAAALTLLMQDENDFDFEPGELKKLVEAGEADLRNGNVVTLAQARRQLRQRYAPNR